MFGVYMNYFSVLVAAVASQLFSWLWYGPLFGKKWTEIKSSTGDGAKKSISTKVWSFVSAFVFAWGLAYVLGAAGIAFDLTGALTMALVVWIAFVATTLAHDWLWEGKSGKFFAFKIICQLFSIVIMTLILALW